MVTFSFQGWTPKWDETIPRHKYATHIRPRTDCLTGPKGDESRSSVASTYNLPLSGAAASQTSDRSASDAAKPGLERVLKFIKTCAEKQPHEVVRCNLAESLLTYPVTDTTSCSAILCDIVDILGSNVCSLPQTPNNPKDIATGSAANNWPDMLTKQVELAGANSLLTFEQMIDAMLLGKSSFYALLSNLTVVASGAIFKALSLHFRKFYTSHIYRGALLRFCATLVETPQRSSNRNDYSAEVLLTVVRGMLQLLFMGEFRYEFIVPCSSFLRSCAKFNNLGAEFELVSEALDKVMQACIPALDPLNNQRVHIIWLPRTMLDFALNSSANAISRISVDSILFDAAISLGWCILRQDQADGNHLRVQLDCGVILAVLRSNFEQLSFEDIAAAVQIPANQVSDCLSKLSSLGLIQILSDGSAVASDPKYSAQFNCGLCTPAAVSSHIPADVDIISPVSPASVEAYIRLCHCILLRLIHSKDGIFEAQLVFDVAQEQAVRSNHVQQCIYFLTSRRIVRVISLGFLYFVRLNLDQDDHVAPKNCPPSSLYSVPKLHKSGVTDDFVSKVVVFAPSGEASDDQACEGISNIVLSMNPASCYEFSNKSSAENFLTLVISQLQHSLGISFLLAAKELIQCHGFPERVIIKFLDASIFSSMFPNNESSPPRTHRAGAHPTVSNASAIAEAMPSCSVCLDGESSLIRLPCGHLLCDECFTHCFLSDVGQHTFGTLPQEATPVAACLDEDGDTPRCRDFFSCPTCKVSLAEHFWDEFPDHLVEAQRQRPVSCQVTLHQVYRRIVASALRMLRQDPLSSIARCDGSRCLKDRYIAAASTWQAVTCNGRTFDCVADFRAFEDEANLPRCGLTPLHISQWKHTSQEVLAELKKSQAPLVNLAGVAMKRSDQTGLLYCDRFLGSQLIPGSDGRCGPNNGPQCSDCKGFVNSDHLQPTFISDAQRKTRPEDMLKDIRMCPRCFGGYFINTNCAALGSHHGEIKDGVHVQNVCKDCGFFSERWSDWPVADEKLKAQKIKAHLPFLNGVAKSVETIQCILSQDLAIDSSSDISRLSSSSQSLVKLRGSYLWRRFLRNRLITLLKRIITAALERTSHVASRSLVEMSVDSKHTVLLLQLLQVTDSFVKPYLSSVTLLSDRPHSHSYVLCAVLLSFAAVESWPVATLDNFITGNLGTVSTAPAYIKSLLDSAAKRIPVYKAPFASDLSISESMAHYRFSFDGVSCQEFFIAEQIFRELRGSTLFSALEQKFGLSGTHVALALLRHVSVKDLFRLLSLRGIASAVSSLLPLMLPLNFSFQQARTATTRSSRSAAAEDVFEVVDAVVADILSTQRLHNVQLRAVRFDRTRPVETVVLPRSTPEHAATHVSLDSDGCLYVCGIDSKFICVTDRHGAAKCDMYITHNGQRLPTQNLRATAHDYAKKRLYVSDGDAAVVHCVNLLGEVLFSSPAGAVTKPQGLSFCSRTRRVAVADEKFVRILRADDLSPIKILSHSGAKACNSGLLADDLKNCCDVAFDANGFLYAVDNGANLVAVFDCTYVSFSIFGSFGSGDGQFNAARGVCIDGTGKVFVSDSTRVQMFDRQGRHVVSISPSSLDDALTWSQLGSMSVDADGRLLVCSQGSKSLLRIL